MNQLINLKGEGLNGKVLLCKNIQENKKYALKVTILNFK